MTLSYSWIKDDGFEKLTTTNSCVSVFNALTQFDCNKSRDGTKQKKHFITAKLKAHDNLK